jgi:hypothetical protein
LLGSVGAFKKIKEKILRENLSVENRKKFELVQEELKQLKAIEENKTSLVSEEEELREKRSKLKTELKELLAEANSKLGEEARCLMEIMLKMQTEIVSLESDSSMQENLDKLKSLLTDKGIDIEVICQKRLKVTKLEKVLE